MNITMCSEWSDDLVSAGGTIVNCDVVLPHKATRYLE